MKPITTLEAARALPEIQNRYYRVHNEVTDTGETIRVETPRKFSAFPVHPKQILYFLDADGRIMEVVNTEDGFAKMHAES